MLVKIPVKKTQLLFLAVLVLVLVAITVKKTQLLMLAVLVAVATLMVWLFVFARRWRSCVVGGGTC